MFQITKGKTDAQRAKSAAGGPIWRLLIRQPPSAISCTAAQQTAAETEAPLNEIPCHMLRKVRN
jgi:hypothetical protein